MTALLTRRPRADRPSDVLADRQRHAKELAYLGCAGALGYGLMKVDWALGGTVGLRNPKHFHAIEFVPAWGQGSSTTGATPILAGLAIVILLGLVYPWGNRPILRPLLRTVGWAGSLMAVVGADGLILIIRYYAGDRGIGRGDLYAGAFVFTYICPDARRRIRRIRLADATETENLDAQGRAYIHMTIIALHCTTAPGPEPSFG